jgi:hypothetical protein
MAKKRLFNKCARVGSVTYTNDSLAEASDGVRADWHELDTAHDDVDPTMSSMMLSQDQYRNAEQFQNAKESHSLKQMHTIVGKGSGRYMCEGHPLQK